MKTIQFVKESLKSLKEVGTIFPSSKFVVEKMVAPINFGEKLTILELGSGHGVITKQLLEKMSSDSQLICFETNKSFYQELKKINDMKMILINGSAVQPYDGIPKKGVWQTVERLHMDHLAVIGHHTTKRKFKNIIVLYNSHAKLLENLK